MSIGPGTTLGAYVVQDFIGQGAMGVVYRAYHAELERVAAVKVLQGLATDGDSSARFRREAQAIAHMRHPNILNVFDFGEFQGTPYMIVEYVEGGSLSARLKRSPIDQDAALRYLGDGKLDPAFGAAGVTKAGPDLGGAHKVSARHAVFHKIGPDTWMTAVGSNPTFRLAGGKWIQLTNNMKLLVQKGDKLRFADVEVDLA